MTDQDPAKTGHLDFTHVSGFSLTKLIPNDSIACRMSEQAGNITQAAARSAQPYRRHIVGLPLQRSLFGEAARAATTISLPGLSSELDFPARLDENGDLFLDRSKVV